MPPLPLSSFPLEAWLGFGGGRDEEAGMLYEEATVSMGNTPPRITTLITCLVIDKRLLPLLIVVVIYFLFFMSSSRPEEDDNGHAGAWR